MSEGEIMAPVEGAQPGRKYNHTHAVFEGSNNITDIECKILSAVSMPVLVKLQLGRDGLR